MTKKLLPTLTTTTTTTSRTRRAHNVVYLRPFALSITTSVVFIFGVCGLLQFISLSRSSRPLLLLQIRLLTSTSDDEWNSKNKVQDRCRNDADEHDILIKQQAAGKDFRRTSSSSSLSLASSSDSGQQQKQSQPTENRSGFDHVVDHTYRMVYPSYDYDIRKDDDDNNTVGDGNRDLHNSRKAFNLTLWGNRRSKGGLLDEDRIMLADIYSNAYSVFEFGLGESTLIADYVGVPRYAGTDSDPMWIHKTRSQIKSLHYRFYLSDIGPTREWGYPVINNNNNENDDMANATTWKRVLDYQLVPLIAEPLPFDVYMVDGRYRLPCLIVSFLHASSSRRKRGGVGVVGASGTTTSSQQQQQQQQQQQSSSTDNETVVLLHDCIQKGYNTFRYAKHNNRPIYRMADHLLDLVRHSNRYLCAYKRKETTTDNDLVMLWEKYYNAIA